MYLSQWLNAGRQQFGSNVFIRSLLPFIIPFFFSLSFISPFLAVPFIEVTETQTNRNMTVRFQTLTAMLMKFLDMTPYRFVTLKMEAIIFPETSVSV